MAPGKCKICLKSVYPMDPQINLDGAILHKPCAKCADCNCQITLSNFAKHDTAEKFLLLCKTHYFKRFHENGAYLGGEKFAKKQGREINAISKEQTGRPLSYKESSSPVKERFAFHEPVAIHHENAQEATSIAPVEKLPEPVKDAEVETHQELTEE